MFDFKNVTPGNRVIMKNIGGDEPFGGDIPGPQVFGETDRIMAFDVVLPMDGTVPDVTPAGVAVLSAIPIVANGPTRVATASASAAAGYPSHPHTAELPQRMCP